MGVGDLGGVLSVGGAVGGVGVGVVGGGEFDGGGEAELAGGFDGGVVLEFGEVVV